MHTYIQVVTIEGAVLYVYMLMRFYRIEQSLSQGEFYVRLIEKPRDLIHIIYINICYLRTIQQEHCNAYLAWVGISWGSTSTGRLHSAEINYPLTLNCSLNSSINASWEQLEAHKSIKAVTVSTFGNTKPLKSGIRRMIRAGIVAKWYYFTRNKLCDTFNKVTYINTRTHS